ncbi:MAG: alkaline phosphatase [Galactobacter sp.]
MHLKRSLLTGLACAAALGLGVAAPAHAAMPSDITDHGGAQRNDGDQTDALKQAINGSQAKNVILIIGDGMGDSEITSARNYEHGASGEFPGIDALPITGQYTTYSLDKSNGKPDYVTDSAASGSGWATGTKTYNNAISVDIDGKAQDSLLELAKTKGLKTGDVTTSELQDATPAVQVSHVSKRSCYGPKATLEKCPENALENGGAGSITEQLINTRADVTLGGGAATFAEEATAGDHKGKTLLAQAEERGYNIVKTAGDLAAVERADQNEPVLGLFAEGNLPVDWQGAKATLTGGSEPAISCEVNPDFTEDTPRLAAMTSKAIDLLKDADEGFFLQVESASIDKEDHAANPCGQIGETVQLDEAVQEALDFAKKDGDTLVIVTADHAHSSQVVYPGETTLGLTRTLTTKEGQPMTIAYGTADEGGSQMHTGSQLRIAAYGPQAANVSGLTDQTDVFFTVQRALGLPQDADLPSDPAPVEPEPTETSEPTETAEPSEEAPEGDGNAGAEASGDASTDPQPTVDAPGTADGADDGDTESAVAAPGAGGGRDGGDLARTGAAVLSVALIAVGIGGAGWALVANSRRRAATH